MVWVISLVKPSRIKSSIKWVPTQRSGTLSMGNLKSIQEFVLDFQFDTTYKTTSKISMDINGSRNMHSAYSNASKGKSMNSFEGPSVELNYNAKFKCGQDHKHLISSWLNALGQLPRHVYGDRWSMLWYSHTSKISGCFGCKCHEQIQCTKGPSRLELARDIKGPKYPFYPVGWIVLLICIGRETKGTQ